MTKSCKLKHTFAFSAEIYLVLEVLSIDELIQKFIPPKANIFETLNQK